MIIILTLKNPAQQRGSVTAPQITCEVAAEGQSAEKPLQGPGCVFNLSSKREALAPARAAGRLRCCCPGHSLCAAV